MPDNMQGRVRGEFLRIPKDPADARKLVGDLKLDGVDGIKAILQGDFGHIHFVRLDRPIYEAVARAAHADGLPLATHTNTAQDVEDAIGAHSDSIEHGSLTDRLPPADLTAMRDENLAYDPTLSVVGVLRDWRVTRCRPRRSWQQIVPADKLARRPVRQIRAASRSRRATESLRQRRRQPRRRVAGRASTLIAGSDAGNPSIMHGPTVQHELALWVEAGIPATVALQAATGQAARYLRADGRIGLIAAGHQATFILVEGDPMADIHALERVSSVIFRGETVDREALLETRKQR